MKLIKIEDKLINIDKIIYIDIETNTIFFEKDHYIHMKDNDEFNKFVSFYNMYDTDELKRAIIKISRLILANPEYLNEKELKEQIVKIIKYHDLRDYLNEINGGLKLKEMNGIQLVNIYKKLQQKIIDLTEELPF